MEDLVIVESPNKVKTIQSFLGKGYHVVASFGHISKLEKDGPDRLGIDIESWTPSIKLDPTKLKYFNKIKTAAKSAKHIYIATDADREGEAIGGDIIFFLKAEERYDRIKYKEITKQAILEAFKTPVKLNQDLINSQKARRMLDRILGFLLSRLMREKLRNVSSWNLSAGRVQSIALKLVVDKERERESFTPTLYSKIHCELDQDTLLHLESNNPRFTDKSWLEREEADRIWDEIHSLKELTVSGVKQTNVTKAAVTAYKQATLFKNSGLSAQTTSMALQRLYEGYGRGGLISYPRTDATWLSANFVSKAQSYLKSRFGGDLLASEFKGDSGDQDAHEAIRPTDISLTPDEATRIFPLSQSEYLIYRLIYERTIKVLTKAPIFLQTTYQFKAKDYSLYLTRSELVYDGYFAILGRPKDLLTPQRIYKLDQVVSLQRFIREDKQTNPPARYSEGSLIAKLDKIKVGRPSTFAPTVKKIKQRNYVETEEGYLLPTPIGRKVMEKLYQGFKDEVSESYTAKIEEQLDLISEGKVSLEEVMDPFWDKFQAAVRLAKDSLSVSGVEYQRVEGLVCPKGGDPLLYRYRKDSGSKFIACNNFPECNFTANSIEGVINWSEKKSSELSERDCPNCGAKLVLRSSFKGQFFGCSRFPRCRTILPFEEGEQGDQSL